MPKIILCATHGPIQENIPWAQPHAQITYRFEHAVLIYSQLMTQKAAAGILNIPTSTLSDLLHRSITRLREGHVIERLTNIGIDEIAYAKGKKYATIIYDLKTSRVVWVGKGKGRKTVDEFFRTLTRKQKQEIKWASCDLSETYINAIKYHCKWATLVAISGFLQLYLS